jgi:hypothetical protein
LLNIEYLDFSFGENASMSSAATVRPAIQRTLMSMCDELIEAGTTLAQRCVSAKVSLKLD